MRAGLRRATKLVLIVVLAQLSTAAQGAEPPAAPIVPFIEEQTLAVAYFDLHAVEPEALAAEMRMAGLPEAAASRVAEKLPGEMERLRDAGLREVYALLSTDYLLAPPVALVAPLTGEADPEAVGRPLVELMRGSETARLHGTAVVADPYALRRIRRSRAVPMPALEAAMEHAGDAPAWLAFAPTADNRRVIEETMPALPQELGGGPSTVLTRGVRWLTVSATPPPEPTLRVVIQSESPRAALALRDWLEGLLRTFPQPLKALEGIPRAGEVLATLEPRVSGDRVLISLEPDAVRAAVRKMLAPAVRRARKSASVRTSVRNLHHVGLAAAMYRSDHEGHWPDNLRQLAEGGYLDSPDLLRNPRRPNLEVGYEYRKPREDAPPGTAVAWGKFEGWPAGGINVLYVDGAVGTAEDPARFEEVLRKGR